MKTETSPTLRERVQCHPRRWRFPSTAVVACYLGALLLLAYVITTLLGLASLESPDDPIEDPYFTLMEVFILLIMPLMMLAFIALYQWAPTPSKQFYSLCSLGFLAISAGITSSVHFVVWTVSRPITEQVENAEYLFSFSWPSVVYALDILAWDWFFGLSIILAALVVSWTTRIEKSLRILMLLSGFLSLFGLVALPLDNMQVRIIGIVGYAFVPIPIFVLLGVLLGRHPTTNTLDHSVVTSIKDASITEEPREQAIEQDVDLLPVEQVLCSLSQ